MFSIEMKVRDYECDMQGIVNNSVYCNYFEHARHEYLHSIDLDFAALAKQGINLVVTRNEIDYKQSLQSGDVFRVEVGFSRLSRLKVVFEQAIYRQSDNQLMTQARVQGVALNAQGRPFDFFTTYVNQ